MTPEAFILWLQGYIDACGAQLTEAQVTELKAKMNVVQLRGPFRNLQQRLPVGQ